MTTPQKIATCFWFDTQAAEAADFYVSLFDNSRILHTARYGKNEHGIEGSVMLVRFSLAGVEFAALNGGPVFTLSEAASLVVTCDDQAEIDRLWAALLADGGTESRCGWLKDRFGMSWQIIPAQLAAMMRDGDAAANARLMQALLKMVKLDIATLEAAWVGTAIASS